LSCCFIPLPDGRLLLLGHVRTSEPKKKVAKNELIKQETNINRYINYREDELVLAKMYREGISGKLANRPVGDQVLKDLDAKIPEYGLVPDGIIVDDLTRWGRNMRDLIKTIDELVKERGKTFISRNIQLDSSKNDPETRVQFLLLSTLAEIDLIYQTERLRVGCELYVERGGKLGRYKIIIPDIIRKKIVEFYTEKELGLDTVAKVVSPFETYDKRENKIEKTVGRSTIERILREEGIKLRPPKRPVKRGKTRHLMQ